MGCTCLAPAGGKPALHVRDRGGLRLAVQAGTETIETADEPHP